MYKAVPIVAKMLEALKVFEINYCHFKSNEHLGPAISGETCCLLTLNMKK